MKRRGKKGNNNEVQFSSCNAHKPRVRELSKKKSAPY